MFYWLYVTFLVVNNFFRDFIAVPLVGRNLSSREFRISGFFEMLRGEDVGLLF